MARRPVARWMRCLCALLLAACAALATGTAGATQRALLVGVSELVNQPSSLWLQAPRNDVLLMRQTLRNQGFAGADIAVLADGVPGAALPDAQRIHDALGRLLAQSRSGDFVLLYFSGHGTRLRDMAKRYQEPDGLAENFLARDVRGAVGAVGAVGGTAGLSGGLRDVDVDAWIGAFLARNVFVWAVFDTCSAASMTRGAAAGAPPVAEGPADDEVRFRGVRAEQLAARENASDALVAASLGVPAAQDVPRARYVAFFASESHQVTPELRLPRKDRAARPQGLLTWALTEALQRRPATWRELFDGVLALYPPVIAELEARFPQRELPSPVAEGSLDAPLFANGPQPLSTRPVWRAQRSGGSLTLEAGQLDGLEPGQPVRVLATLADGTVRNAEARLAQSDAGSARLDTPPALARFPTAVQWAITPVDTPAAVTLRVRADRPLPDGMALRYPLGVRRVAADEAADVRWSDGGPAGQQLELLSPELAAVFAAGARPAVMTVPDLAALRQRLAALAQIKWLARLNALAGGGQIDGFDATLETWDGTRVLRTAPAQSAASQPPPAAGEQAALTVRNASGHSLDLVIVGIDAQGRVRPVFPQAPGESNRFERGAPDAPAAKRFPLPWLAGAEGGAGGGRLLVLASPAAPQSAPRLFGADASDTLADLRVRGQLATDRARAVYAAMPRWQ